MDDFHSQRLDLPPLEDISRALQDASMHPVGDSQPLDFAPIASIMDDLEDQEKKK